MNKTITGFSTLALFASAVAACSAGPLPGAKRAGVAAVASTASPASSAGIGATQATPARETASARLTAQASSADLPLLVVHKSPSCGCCALWVTHMEKAGFKVEVRNEENMSPVKTRLGVPDDKRSCHTAEVGGYFVEGHVPAADVKRLLAEKPDSRGLAAPGMPAGSPGMEMPDGSQPPYAVDLVARDGSTRVFAQHPGPAEK